MRPELRSVPDRERPEANGLFFGDVNLDDKTTLRKVIKEDSAICSHLHLTELRFYRPSRLGRHRVRARGNFSNRVQVVNDNIGVVDAHLDDKCRRPPLPVSRGAGSRCSRPNGFLSGPPVNRSSFGTTCEEC